MVVDPRSKTAGKRLRSRAVTGAIDIARTILDYAGMEISDKVDGKSLRVLVDNPKAKLRDSMPIFNFFGSAGTHEMTIVTEDHKYIFWAFAGDGLKPAEELYNNTKDGYEINNLAAYPEAAPVLEQMRQYYDTELDVLKVNAIAEHESHW